MAITTALIGSTSAVALFRLLGSEKSLLHLDAWMALAFVCSTAVWSIFSLQDGALTGLRRTVWIPLENGLYGALKLAALFAMVPFFGASVGIFLSWNVVTLLLVIPVNWLIFRRVIPLHIRHSGVEHQPLQKSQIKRFMAGDYLSGLFGQASATLLPILVYSVLGAKAAGYFFVAQVIGNVLDRLPLSLSASLTVEGARDNESVIENARSVLRKGMLLTIAASGFVAVFAPWILQMFGAEYREEATTLLRLLALSSIPRVLMGVFGSLARISHNTHQLAMTSFIQTTVLLVAGVLLMNSVGLVGIGIAAIAAQAVVLSFIVPRLFRQLQGQ